MTAADPGSGGLGRTASGTAGGRRRCSRAGAASRYMLPAALMAGMIGLWSVSLAPLDVRGRVDAQEGIRIRFLSPSERVEGARDRSWPAVLMSLPSSEGFSGDVLNDRIFVEPEPNEPEVETWFLERKRKSASKSELTRIRPILAYHAGESFHPLSRPLRPFVPASERSNVEVLFLRGLKESDFLQVPIPEGIERESETLWIARLKVELGPDGDVRLVMLEQGTGLADLDRALVRSVYRWRGRRAGEGARGEVRIGFTGVSGSRGREEIRE